MLGGMAASYDSSSAGEAEAEVLEELLTQQRAALDPYYGESDPSTYVAMYADKVTTFDPWSNGKLEGSAARDHLMGFAGTIPPLAYEIVDPRVDLYDDTAIFTFNVDLTDPDAGATFAVWNTTEVHRRTDDGWELVHSHWSFATPPPQDAET
jgi:ketosteroid isomerase-like protein